MQWLLGLLTGIPGLLKDGLAYLSKLEDAGVEKERIRSQVDTSVLGAAVDAGRVQSEERRSAMAHPVWWVAWAAFVAPVALYKACIFWVSTFPGLGWAIQKVPQAELDDAKIIVLSMFGLHATTTIIDKVATAWSQRK